MEASDMGIEEMNEDSAQDLGKSHSIAKLQIARHAQRLIELKERLINGVPFITLS